MRTAGTRAVLRAHQTLRAALAWSHALLCEEERVVFRRPGVFSGGFTLASRSLQIASGAFKDGGRAGATARARATALSASTCWWRLRWVGWRCCAGAAFDRTRSNPAFAGRAGI
jgi:predicted ATPase